MKAKSVRKHLKHALDEVEQARGADIAPDIEDQLAGIAEILRMSEDPPMSPEARVYPERGALDMIQRRLTEIIAQTDDDAVVEDLQRAKREILLVIVTLDDQWKKQHR